MAIIHRSTLTPSKLEVASTWASEQPWWPGGTLSDGDKLGAYRFDDPAGQVGIEGIVVGLGESIVQVLLTYRDAPLVGAEHALLGTMEHSVLGTRYVYDGCSDPVAITALADAEQAREMIEDPSGPVEREPSIRLVRNGGTVPVAPSLAVGDVVTAGDATGTAITAPGLHLVLRRVLDAAAAAPLDVPALLGTWSGQSSPVLLAHG
jgi:hypothetical protein